MGAFLTGIAMTAFLSDAAAREVPASSAYITTNHFWDLGKIMFAFCIFWVYQFWAQYLPIWYAEPARRDRLGVPALRGAVAPVRVRRVRPRSS